VADAILDGWPHDLPRFDLPRKKQLKEMNAKLNEWNHEWFGLWDDGVLKYYPDFRDYVDLDKLDDQEKVLFYLNSSPILEVYPLFQGCRICNENIKHGLRTDNELVWSMNLPHFMEKHDVGLPKRFIDKIRNAEYIPPKTCTRNRGYFNLPNVEKKEGVT
jgi:hypothetical protein